MQISYLNFTANQQIHHVRTERVTILVQEPVDIVPDLNDTQRIQ